MSAAGALSSCFVEPGGAGIRMSTQTVDYGRRSVGGGGSSHERSTSSTRRQLAEDHMKNPMSETTKAAAWAVFQHHGGAAKYNRSYGIGAVRRVTRFKIEAQMKNGSHHHAVAATVCTSASLNNQWDAGSTLFDSYELDSLSKQFDQAFQLLSPASSYSPEHPGGASRLAYDLDDESRPIIDTTRVTSPFSPQQSHQDERVLPAERMRDSVEDSYTVEHRVFQQPSGATLAVQLLAYSSHESITRYNMNEEPTDYGPQNLSARNSLAGTASWTEEESTSEEAVTLEVGQKLHGPFQLAHTSNPLNLSQRKLRRGSMDKSHDTDGARQSFQEKLRSFFHKARISPQDSPSQRDPNRRERKFYTSPEFDSLSHYGWSYLDDHTHTYSSEESTEELLQLQETTTAPPPPPQRQQHKLAGLIWKVRAESKKDADQSLKAHDVANACDSQKLSKHRKSGSFSLRSVTKALHSLPHLGVSESHRQPRLQNSDTHHHHHQQQELQHHHVYNHQHHHVFIDQQQPVEDYELTLQDIDKRVPRKSIEEKTRRISFEDATNNNNFKVSRNSLEEKREHTDSSEEKTNSAPCDSLS